MVSRERLERVPGSRVPPYPRSATPRPPIPTPTHRGRCRNRCPAFSLRLSETVPCGGNREGAKVAGRGLLLVSLVSLRGDDLPSHLRGRRTALILAGEKRVPVPSRWRWCRGARSHPTDSRVCACERLGLGCVGRNTNDLLWLQGPELLGAGRLQHALIAARSKCRVLDRSVLSVALPKPSVRRTLPVKSMATSNWIGMAIHAGVAEAKRSSVRRSRTATRSAEYREHLKRVEAGCVEDPQR